MSDSRDYYADLELPSSADDAEIKKQFRKLALKYHPDRNPGREDEVRPKFQIIQKAHEILSDPAAKSKYDSTRNRSGGRYPTSSGVRGNPWQNAASNFPPPPRRNAGTTGGRTAASGGPSGGAQRWQTRFAQGVPPTAKQYQSADQKTKENAAKAFENMRKAQSAGAKKASRPTDPPPMPPRSATARQRAEASFGTRKTSSQARPPSRGDHHTFAEARPVPDPLDQFREAKTPRESRQRMPYASHGGEKTDPRNPAESNTHEPSTDGAPSFSQPDFQSRPDGDQTNAGSSQAGTDGPSMYASPSSAASPMRCRVTPKRPNRTPSGDLFGQNNLPQIYKSENSKMPSGMRRVLSEASVFEKQQHDVLSMLIDKNNATFASSNTTPAAAQQPEMHAANQKPLSFNFDVDEDAFVRTSPQQANFGKTSLDDINTQFSQHQPDTWKFSAGHTAAEQPGSQSPSKNPAATAAEPDGNTQEADEGFNATGWADKFGPQTFAPQANAPNNTSPSKASRANSKKSKSGRTGNAGADDGSSDEDIYEWNGRKTQKDGLASSPQAMEIDSPPSRPGGPARSNSVRNIPVEPSRPEWRSGNFENVPPAVPPRQPSPIKPTVGGSEDSEDFVAANFSDMKNVPPFARPAAGLKSFMDLKDNLPFDSQAAPESPSKVPKAQPLIFPSPPTAPRLPPTVAVEGIKPTTASWSQYLEEFERYLAEWESFNAKVVDHFAARNSQIAKMRAEKGYSFLGSRRDDDCRDYYNWIEQDNDVRRRWNAACEGHEMHFRDLMAFREKMKQ